MNETKFYLGIDWGGKRIGLALADSETRLATPFKTIASLEELLEVIVEERIDVVVLGEPIKMRGGEDLDPSFLDFFNKLKKELGEERIKTVDERLTSQQADKLLGSRKTKASRDEISAALILQTYLDNL